MEDRLIVDHLAPSSGLLRDKTLSAKTNRYRDIENFTTTQDIRSAVKITNNSCAANCPPVKDSKGVALDRARHEKACK